MRLHKSTPYLVSVIGAGLCGGWLIAGASGFGFALVMYSFVGTFVALMSLICAEDNNL